MSTLIHVLGADISHHNRTLLCFFNEHLANTTHHAREFMVVSQDKALASYFPKLTIRLYTSKSALASAVISIARKNHQQHFFFHGQFNHRLWLALLFGEIRPAQMNWHIWGADLYENSRSIKFRLFYLLRRLAQKRVGYVFATLGDLNYFHQRNPNIKAKLLYFPTRMPLSINQDEGQRLRGKDTLTILIGNSGDPSNQHIKALREIHENFGSSTRVIIPMGYPEGNDAYIEKVTREGRKLFSDENINILNTKISFAVYHDLLTQCDLGYFIFERQQGIGTLCLLIQSNIPCVISDKNPFWQDMAAQQLPVLFAGTSLNITMINEAKKQMQLVDKTKISFFYPSYIAEWRHVIETAGGAVE